MIETSKMLEALVWWNLAAKGLHCTVKVEAEKPRPGLNPLIVPTWKVIVHKRRTGQALSVGMSYLVSRMILERAAKYPTDQARQVAFEIADMFSRSEYACD